MGIEDRDYMRSRREWEQPFRPPESALRSTLYIILWWTCIIYLCFKAFSWWDKARPNPPRTSFAVPQVSSTARNPEKPSPVESIQNEASSIHIDVNAPRATAPYANKTMVNRCVLDGRVTFSDTSCARGASSQQVIVNGSQNMADGLRDPASVLRSSPPATVISQTEPAGSQGDLALDSAARRSTCAWLEAAIRNIDAQARQPISAAEQDYLASKRKSHRDEQFRLRC